MHWIDWLIVAVPLFIVAWIAIYTQRFVKGVADFLAASRVAGRYVVAVASGEAAMGLISVVAVFEMYYNAGFAYGFWGGLSTPLGIVLLLTGFAIYRYRETRAMTLAQFLEVRYSKNFRIFAGILQSISGIINYGLFPAVGARFLVYYCDLPAQVEFLGMPWPTFGVVMAMALSAAVLITTLGGQVTIMTTDCIQGILSYPMYLIIVVVILVKFSWYGQMDQTLLDRPAGESLLNPYDITALRDFNLFYVFSGMLGGVLNRLSWSGTQGYNAAAATAHEQKMGAILGTWRAGFSGMMILLLAVVAYTYFHNADFADQAAKTENYLNWKTLNDIAPQKDYRPGMTVSDEVISQRVEKLDDKKKQVFGTIHEQMRVPVALRDILPVGATGAFCALMIFLMISTDTTYLHSWGSILIQDVVLPFRKKPFTPRQQLLLLRLAITAVAIFGFFFSFYFGQVTYILMFFAITGSIWLGGAGAVIIGGLYWKKGTAAGAWTSLITGSGIATLGIIGEQFWVAHIYPAMAKSPMVLAWVSKVIQGISHPFEPFIVWRVTPEKFPINGQEIYFLTMVLAVGSYIVISLLTSRENFNLDRMLHRGKYHHSYDKNAPVIEKPPRSVRGVLGALLGIDAQFTRGDKILSWSVFIYSFFWGFGSWIAVIVWNTIAPWPNAGWSHYFFVMNIVIAGAIGLVSTVWFTIGGTLDLRRMFQRLKAVERNVLDDGRVMGHMNVEDLAFIEETSLDQQAPQILPPEQDEETITPGDKR